MEALSDMRKANGRDPVAWASTSPMAAPWEKATTRPPGCAAAILSMAARSRPFAFTGADNASISRLVISGDRWILRGFNDTAHLDGLS
jgi:hypothetical protein